MVGRCHRGAGVLLLAFVVVRATELPYNLNASCDDEAFTTFWEELRQTLQSYAPTFALKASHDEPGQEISWWRSVLRVHLMTPARYARECLEKKGSCCDRCPSNHRLGGLRCSVATLSMRLFFTSFLGLWSRAGVDHEGNEDDEDGEEIRDFLQVVADDIASALKMNHWMFLVDGDEWPIMPFLEHAAVATSSAVWNLVFQREGSPPNCNFSRTFLDLLRPAEGALQIAENQRVEAIRSGDGGGGPWDYSSFFDFAKRAVVSAWERDPAIVMHCAAAVWRRADNLACKPMVTMSTLVGPGGQAIRMWLPPYRDNLADAVRGFQSPQCSTYFMDELHFRSKQRPGANLLLLDVGAAYGDCVVTACASYGPRVQMFAYEPVIEMAQAIQRSAAANGFLGCDVHVWNVAMGSSHRRDILKVGRGTFGLSELPDEQPIPGYEAMRTNLYEAEARPVTVETLDRQAERYGWGEVDVLKVHVQGLEAAVLEGGRQLLRRTRSLVVRGGPAYNTAFRRHMVALIRDYGFTILDEEAPHAFTARKLGV
eukprot:TRINITY_DN38711_c0_g1_i1.p1 TRINITY_DN38711_c0_g1~~TRINITY_DN38711_c0_g1_i1.p1  ORF type:complete len:540 (+),score=92.10 TRINITY_DN38711_c0_g1_i1:65-1684(+)